MQMYQIPAIGRSLELNPCKCLHGVVSGCSDVGGCSDSFSSGNNKHISILTQTLGPVLIMTMLIVL